jgi:hypothetical protein
MLQQAFVFEHSHHGPNGRVCGWIRQTSVDISCGNFPRLKNDVHDLTLTLAESCFSHRIFPSNRSPKVIRTTNQMPFFWHMPFF